MTDQLALLTSHTEKADPTVFRPIHYLGSKFRLLGAIESTVDAVALGQGRVCDLFSGSGVVAAYLGRERPAVAVDIQEYSRVLASAVLNPPPLSTRAIDQMVSMARAMETSTAAEIVRELTDYEERGLARAHEGDAEPLCTVLEHGSLVAFERDGAPVPPDFAQALRGAAKVSGGAGATLDGEPALARYFGGVYFSYRQAFGLQCALAAVRSLPAESRDMGLAAVISAASEVVSTVGNQFAQPIRPRGRDGRPKHGVLGAVARRRLTDALGVFERWLHRYRELPAPAYGHDAVRADYRDFLASYAQELAVVYADPPYTRDHYSRFYHVLETLARQDDPGVSVTRIGGKTRLSRGLYRAERHQSPFCIKSQAPGAFADLFAGVRKFEAPLVLSYSPYDSAGRDRPRLMTIDSIVSLARKQYRSVGVVSAEGIVHSKLNAAHLNVVTSGEPEVIVVCQP